MSRIITIDDFWENSAKTEQEEHDRLAKLRKWYEEAIVKPMFAQMCKDLHIDETQVKVEWTR